MLKLWTNLKQYTTQERHTSIIVGIELITISTVTLKSIIITSTERVPVLLTWAVCTEICRCREEKIQKELELRMNLVFAAFQEDFG